jgi:hypothetical protein
MFAPILTKAWNIYPNLRRPYTSLADQMGWFFYENKTKMLASGWTVKFTSDGTNGPTSAGDTTDRWTSIASASAFRATVSGAAQSWAVLQNSDGLQVLFTFQGASDDVGRISYSPGGLFTPQGFSAPTFTYQPTATDETIISVGTTIVNATTSSDRVMSIWCTADSTQWSFMLARAGFVTTWLGIERIISYCGTGVLNVPYAAYRYTYKADRGGLATMENNPSSNGGGSCTPGGFILNTAAQTAGFSGCIARVFTNSASRVVRCGGGAICVSGIADTFTRTLNDRAMFSNFPALQGSRMAPCYPFFWCGEKVTNLDGILGSPIDWWFCHTATMTNFSGVTAGFPFTSNMLPGFDLGDDPNTDPVRSNWLVALGSEAVRPWRDVAAAMLLS